MMIFWIIINAGVVTDQSKVGTQYLVLFDNILHRQRFPKFMEIVSQELGDKVGFVFVHTFSLKLFYLNLNG
jgi:hypothetical protein